MHHTKKDAHFQTKMFEQLHEKSPVKFSLTESVPLIFKHQHKIKKKTTQHNEHTICVANLDLERKSLTLGACHFRLITGINLSEPSTSSDGIKWLI